MYSKLLSIVFFFFLLINLTIYADQSVSVIAFEPSYISIIVGENRSVTVRLLIPDIIPPDVFIEFLYNDKPKDTQGYIDILPNITFTQQAG
ncbi:unnamed protein product, partial [Rotaria sp. Silwood1]